MLGRTANAKDVVVERKGKPARARKRTQPAPQLFVGDQHEIGDRVAFVKSLQVRGPLVEERDGNAHWTLRPVRDLAQLLRTRGGKQDHAFGIEARIRKRVVGADRRRDDAARRAVANEQARDLRLSGGRRIEDDRDGRGLAHRVAAPPRRIDSVLRTNPACLPAATISSHTRSWRHSGLSPRFGATPATTACAASRAIER